MDGRDRRVRQSFSLGFVIFEFNVQTVFDSDLHLDGVVDVWWHAIRMDPNVLFLNDLCHPTTYRHSHEVTLERHINVSY